MILDFFVIAGIALIGFAIMMLLLFCVNGANRAASFNAAKSVSAKVEQSSFPTIGKYAGDCKFPSLELELRETKTGNRIDFAVQECKYECLEWASEEQFRANCAWPYRFDPQVSVEYTIRTYDKNGRQVAVYEAHSARFLFWDKWDEEGKIVDGGSEELAESQNDIRLPCDSKSASIWIRIEDNSLTREHWGLENAGEEKELVRVQE